jgi:hypothetical protein
MLDRVFIYRDIFLALIVLETTKPIATTTKMVEIAMLELPMKFLLPWKTAIGR